MQITNSSVCNIQQKTYQRNSKLRRVDQETLANPLKQKLTVDKSTNPKKPIKFKSKMSQKFLNATRKQDTYVAIPINSIKTEQKQINPTSRNPTIESNTNRISRSVVRIHLMTKLGKELRTSINRARSRTMLDDWNDIERDSTHIKKHTGDVD